MHSLTSWRDTRGAFPRTALLQELRTRVQSDCFSSRSGTRDRQQHLSSVAERDQLSRARPFQIMNTGMPARITPKQISVMTGSLISAFSSIPTDAIRKMAGVTG